MVKPRKYLLLLIGASLCCSAAFAQATGSITGKVTTEDGQVLPGVVVEASGDVLPQDRATTTSGTGEYRFTLLPPGNYEVTFSLGGMNTERRQLRVLLQQNSALDVTMRPETVEEAIVVFAEAPLIDTSSAELKSAIDDRVIESLPVGQTYRDLVKLIPGVQYTEDSTRGPSAGGSGQDNVYMFDGADVALPLFGNLATGSQPSSHDIDQISVVKGGAKAIDFNRSGGFSINSISRSGTNELKGSLSYQLQTEGMTEARKTEAATEYEQDKDWLVANIGGPIAPEHLFFYASYYRPTTKRGSRANLYGEVPDLEENRDEYFAKLSYTPTSSVLLHASYRDSEVDQSGYGVSYDYYAGSTSYGSDSQLTIATVEGSWLISDNASLSFKYSDFENPTSGKPDNMLGFGINDDGSVNLDVSNLDTQGRLHVPEYRDGEDAYNAFVAPIIERYGYLEGGQRVGGGYVGPYYEINDQDFFRTSYQLGYDHYLAGDAVSHELHLGYQWSESEEALERTSNGWGRIEVIGGRTNTASGIPAYYEARFQQQTLPGETIPTINSWLETQNIEINDTMRWKNWAFNVGFVFSNDQMFGEGLRENSSNVSGFELALGNKYEMYEIDFQDTISPRLGVIWNFGGSDTVYANYATYYPAANSLPRAASWARNLAREIYAYFDADGNFIETSALVASSGKFFVPDMNPRSIDEFLLGISKRLNDRWTGKAHARYRYGHDFWEDTNNTARSAYDAPAGISHEDYIPELGAYRAEVGGSSYVIAELDKSFTKYWEVNLEADWRGEKTYFKGSYVWSHYYGNFDQDNSSGENDDNIFIGSSYIADGAGRQLWNYKYGNLRGDRRHQLKAYGYYRFDWDATAGLYAIYQSGQPWEAWDVEVYRAYTSSTNEINRYAEPAGSRKNDDHYQIDANYTHNFRFADRYNFQLRLDIYNLTDNQTGYNIQNRVHTANFGVPRDNFDPRRYQVAVKFEF